MMVMLVIMVAIFAVEIIITIIIFSSSSSTCLPLLEATDMSPYSRYAIAIFAIPPYLIKSSAFSTTGSGGGPAYDDDAHNTNINTRQHLAK